MLLTTDELFSRFRRHSLTNDSSEGQNISFFLNSNMNLFAVLVFVDFNLNEDVELSTKFVCLCPISTTSAILA